MSYDFELYRVLGDVDPNAAYEKHVERRRQRRSSFRDSLGPVDPVKEQTKRGLVAALIAVNPELQEFRWNYEKLAKEKSIDESEARRRYREVQLTDDFGLEITLFDDTAAVTIPFRPNSEKVLRVAWECLRTLESEGHFSTYDSQIGRVLNLAQDFDVVLKTLTNANRMVERTLRGRR